MLIQIDKDAEKLLTEVTDGYLKYVGIRGMQNVTTLMQSVKLIDENAAQAAAKPPMPKVPMNKVSDEAKETPVHELLDSPGKAVVKDIPAKK